VKDVVALAVDRQLAKAAARRDNHGGAGIATGGRQEGLIGRVGDVIEDAGMDHFLSAGAAALPGFEAAATVGIEAHGRQDADALGDGVEHRVGLGIGGAHGAGGQGDLGVGHLSEHSYSKNHAAEGAAQHCA
jgi:hypothetical protein